MIEIFKTNIENFKKSLEWLKYSYEKAKDIDLDKEVSEFTIEEFDILENLASRFGRTIDILINKVLRSIAALELTDFTSNLDLVILAEKKNFIDDYKKLIIMKDLRNKIVHEYDDESLLNTLKKMVLYSKDLIKVSDTILDYSKKLILKLEG